MRDELGSKMLDVAFKPRTTRCDSFSGLGDGHLDM